MSNTRKTGIPSNPTIPSTNRRVTAEDSDVPQDIFPSRTSTFFDPLSPFNRAQPSRVSEPSIYSPPTRLSIQRGQDLLLEEPAEEEEEEVQQTNERESDNSTLEDVLTSNSISSSSSTNSMSDVNIGGLTIRKRNTANINLNTSALYEKGTRANLNASELTSLFQRATKQFNGGLRFKALPMEMTDPKQLSEFHNIDSVIQSFRENAEMYDFADVFQIVFPTANGDLATENVGGADIPKVRNLFIDYTRLSPTEVAASNRWYHQYTDDSANQMHQNLQWSLHSLKNNIDPVFLMRLNQVYERYDTLEHGGPLLFVLVMNELLFTNEASITALAKQVKEYKIYNVGGENIKNVAAILLSVSRRIWYSKSHHFPERYVDDILKTLQTTSVPAFNNQFDNLTRQRTSELAASAVARLEPSSITLALATGTRPITNTLNTVEYLLRMAQTFYDTFVQEGTWTHYVKSTSTPRVLHADSVCFNCGEKHHLSNCPSPLDSARIERNRKAYSNSKKSSSSSKNISGSSTSKSNSSDQSKKKKRVPKKWSRPEPDENGRRIIWTQARGSAPYKWNDKTKRWDLLSDGSNTIVTPATNPSSMSEAERRVFKANLTRQLEQVNELL